MGEISWEILSILVNHLIISEKCNRTDTWICLLSSSLSDSHSLWTPQNASHHFTLLTGLRTPVARWCRKKKGTSKIKHTLTFCNHLWGAFTSGCWLWSWRGNLWAWLMGQLRLHWRGWLGRRWRGVRLKEQGSRLWSSSLGDSAPKTALMGQTNSFWLNIQWYIQQFKKSKQYWRYGRCFQWCLLKSVLLQ